MSIFTIVFAFLAFSGIFIAVQAVTAKPRQDLIAERLAQYRDHNLTLDEIELSLPFSERFIKPALERLGSLLTARMAKNRQLVVQNKLNLAGRPYGLTVNGVEELHTFIQALIQSEQLGVGIAKVLRIQSEEMRRRRRQRAEEKAAQAPLKMLFPMIGCIFPTLFIVLMGPAVIIIIHTFQHK